MGLYAGELLLKTKKHYNLYDLAKEISFLNRLLARNYFEKIDLFISDISHSYNLIAVRQVVTNLSVCRFTASNLFKKLISFAKSYKL